MIRGDATMPQMHWSFEFCDTGAVRIPGFSAAGAVLVRQSRFFLNENSTGKYHPKCDQWASAT
jgi:hypothetical protein